jgi:hypothetical protein
MNKKKKIGAKKGKLQKLKLEKKAEEVLKYVNLELSRVAMSKLLKCNRLTVNKFLERFPIKDGKYTTKKEIQK